MTLRTLLPLGALLAAVGFVAIAAIGDDEPTSSATSLTCPAVSAVYEDAGLAVPDTFGPACPDPDALRQALEGALVSGEQVDAARAIRKALKAGVISEGQDPATYPPRLLKYVD